MGMTTFEKHLIDVRAGVMTDKERARREQLKSISTEIEASAELKRWLSKFGGVEFVTNAKAVAAWVSRLKKGSVIGLDIETAKAIPEHPMAGLLPAASKVRLVQLWQRGLPVLVVDVSAAGLDWMRGLLGHKLAAHNASFERRHLEHAGVMGLDIRCTMLMLRVFGGKNVSLVQAMKMVGDDFTDDQSAADVLGVRISKALQVSDWARPELLDEQVTYAAGDAVAAVLLHEHLDKALQESESCFARAEGALQSLVHVVAGQAPVHIDTEAHEAVWHQWEQEAEQTRVSLSEAGLADPSKPAHRQRWIADMLGDAVMDWPLTEAGNLKTDRDTIAEHGKEHAVLTDLVSHVKASALLANFGSKLTSLSVNGKVWPGYQVAGMVAGRFGCSSPNLQNIPKSMRHIFIAPPGHRLITGDLSQIELRTAGIVANEPVIRQAYAQGLDLHRLMAAKVTGKPETEITKADRQLAKAVNFGLLYGMGARTLQAYAAASYGVAMTEDEAYAAKAAFHAAYPALTWWQQEIVGETNMRGYAETRHFQLRRYFDREVYSHAMNHPIQGSAAEVLWLALLHAHRERPDPRIMVQLHVYDELCLVAPTELEHEAAILLRDAFAHGYRTVFEEEPPAGLVGIGSGSNWAEAASDDSVRPEWSI
jgi:DNA polymerase-1